MATHASTALSVAPPIAPMQDVLDAEADAERLEGAVYAEMVRLQSLRKEVDGYLTRARRSAEDPALKSFLDGVSVPQPSTDQPVNEARAARFKAVAARKVAVTAMNTRLQAHQQELERLAERLKEEEAAAKARADKKREEASLASQAEPPAEVAEIVSAFSSSANDTVVTKPKPKAAEKKSKHAEKPAAATAINPAVQNAAPTKDERRIAQRISVCTEISLGSESNFFTGFTGDISEGGVFMATVEVMPVGTEVEVSFTLPTGAKIDAKGQVRWVRELDILNPEQFPGMGIQFTQVPASSVAAIHQFANEREPMFFPES